MTVTSDNVADRLGRPRPAADSPQARQWDLWIDQAVQQITRYQRLHGLSDPDPGDVDYVVLESVAAMVEHPSRSKKVSIQIDDGATSREYESGTGSVSLDDWWDYLWPTMEPDGAFSVRPSFQPDHHHHHDHHDRCC